MVNCVDSPDFVFKPRLRLAVTKTRKCHSESLVQKKRSSQKTLSVLGLLFSWSPKKVKVGTSGPDILAYLGNHGLSLDLFWIGLIDVDGCRP